MTIPNSRPKNFRAVYEFAARMGKRVALGDFCSMGICRASLSCVADSRPDAELDRLP